MTELEKIDADLKILIGGVMGESSMANSFEEMAAIAAVLIRQKTLRKRTTWAEFVAYESSFAFAFSDGNPRYKLVADSSDESIQKNEPLATAFKAVKHAINEGLDYSNGAYFWDGDDIKTNYVKHFKVHVGIHITLPNHNVFNIKDSSRKYEKFKVTGSGKSKKKELIASCDWVYESTAGISGTYKKTTYKTVPDRHGKPHKVPTTIDVSTGTIFWKMNDIYIVNFNSGIEYK